MSADGENNKASGNMDATKTEDGKAEGGVEAKKKSSTEVTEEVDGATAAAEANTADSATASGVTVTVRNNDDVKMDNNKKPYNDELDDQAEPKAKKVNAADKKTANDESSKQKNVDSADDAVKDEPDDIKSEYDDKNTTDAINVEAVVATNDGARKDKQKTDQKEKNGKLEKSENEETSRNSEVDEDDENVVALSEIERINENINKTRVDGLQTLHSICFDGHGKNNVVKKNLRSFAGFEFAKDSTEYKKKLDTIKRVDTKSLKNICDILSLERKGNKDEMANRVLKFLMEPDETLCVEAGAEDDEDMDEDDIDEEDEEQTSADDKRKTKASTGRATARNSGRPRRSTAGKKMSAYVDFSSSDESDHKVIPAKRRRNDDSESGSDYNPSANSDSDGGRGRKTATTTASRGNRGRQARKSRRRNSDSEEEESELSDADSDVPKRGKRTMTAISAAGKRGRPAAPARGARKRGAAPRKRKDSESEEEEVSEEEEEEELTDFGSEQSEEEQRPKKNSKKPMLAKNNKANNSKAKPAGKVAGRPKKAKKETSEEEDEYEDKDESDEEPLNKKGKTAFPTDEQIRSYVKEILDQANLEEITMKTVCKQVYAKYPDFDLTDKKDFIKATVKALIAA